MTIGWHRQTQCLLIAFSNHLYSDQPDCESHQKLIITGCRQRHFKYGGNNLFVKEI